MGLVDDAAVGREARVHDRGRARAALAVGQHLLHAAADGQDPSEVWHVAAKYETETLKKASNSTEAHQEAPSQQGSEELKGPQEAVGGCRTAQSHTCE